MSADEAVHGAYDILRALSTTWSSLPDPTVADARAPPLAAGLVHVAAVQLEASPAQLLQLLAATHAAPAMECGDVARVNESRTLWPALAKVSPAVLAGALEMADFWQLPVAVADRVRQEAAARDGIATAAAVPDALAPLVAHATERVSASVAFVADYMKGCILGGIRGLQLGAAVHTGAFLGLRPSAAESGEQLWSYAIGAVLGGHGGPDDTTWADVEHGAHVVPWFPACATAAAIVGDLRSLVYQAEAFGVHVNDVEPAAALMGRVDVLAWAASARGTWLRDDATDDEIAGLEESGVDEPDADDVREERYESLVRCAIAGRHVAAVRAVLGRLPAEERAATVATACEWYAEMDMDMHDDSDDVQWLGQTGLCECERHAAAANVALPRV